MSGNAFALHTRTGERLWTEDLRGAVGGGVISYEIDGNQRAAFAAGMTSPIWRNPTGRLVVFGLRK